MISLLKITGIRYRQIQVGYTPLVYILNLEGSKITILLLYKDNHKRVNLKRRLLNLIPVSQKIITDPVVISDDFVIEKIKFIINTKDIITVLEHNNKNCG